MSTIVMHILHLFIVPLIIAQLPKLLFKELLIIKFLSTLALYKRLMKSSMDLGQMRMQVTI